MGLLHCRLVAQQTDVERLRNFNTDTCWGLRNLMLPTTCWQLQSVGYVLHLHVSTV